MGSLSEVERLVEYGVREIILRSRGSCVTFKTKDVAKVAGLSTHPIVLSVVRSILDEMVRKGLIGVWRAGRRRRRYIVAEGSPLWREAKVSKIAIGVRG